MEENNLSTKRVLITMAVQSRGDWNEICRRIHHRLLPTDDEVEEVLNNLKCQVITYFDKEYPEELKKVEKAPFVLFYEGDISLISKPSNILAVVGTREPTDFGIEVTKNIIKDLNKDIVIISGLALGIDAIAHEEAIKNGLKTVAVLGSGVNVCYPLTNKSIYRKIKKDHLIISEYPFDTQPVPENFPLRNRIIAGLAKCVLVTEAKRRSGTTITIGYALDASREVLCVPSSNLNDSACNLCIKDGGFLVENADDVNAFYRY